MVDSQSGRHIEADRRFGKSEAKSRSSMRLANGHRHSWDTLFKQKPTTTTTTTVAWPTKVSPPIHPLTFLATFDWPLFEA